MKHFLRNIKKTMELARRGAPPNVIQVCPICLEDTLTQQPSFLTFITPTVYSCSTCQYNGPVYAEVPIEDFLKLKTAN